MAPPRSTRLDLYAVHNAKGRKVIQGQANCNESLTSRVTGVECLGIVHCEQKVSSCMFVTLICHHVSHVHVILVHVTITLQTLQQQLYFNNKKLDVANF
jgi:hypothetical protein